MTRRQQALRTLAEEIHRRAGIAIAGKYCDATYGADTSIEDALQEHLPAYRIKLAKEMGAETVLKELEPYWNAQRRAVKP